MQQLRERYIEAMAKHPETADELAEATRLAVEAIEEEPWQRCRCRAGCLDNDLR